MRRICIAIIVAASAAYGFLVFDQVYTRFNSARALHVSAVEVEQ
jgi:citrate lyase beta subunit